LGSESQDRLGHEIKEDDKEKDNKKTDITDGETRRHVTFSANVGRAWVLDWWRSQRSESKR